MPAVAILSENTSLAIKTRRKTTHLTSHSPIPCPSRTDPSSGTTQTHTSLSMARIKCQSFSSKPKNRKINSGKSTRIELRNFLKHRRSKRCSQVLICLLRGSTVIFPRLASEPVFVKQRLMRNCGLLSLRVSWYRTLQMQSFLRQI